MRYEHPSGAVSYFKWRKGFSFNESQFPNICLLWDGGIFFYIAFSRRLKWWFNSPRRGKVA